MFAENQVYCVYDYETFSEANLKKVGGWEYSVHPSTEILCAAFRIGTRAELETAKTSWWSPNLPDPEGNFGKLLRAFRNKDVILVAHNALFEQVITRNVFGPKYMPSKVDELSTIPPSRFICTASLAAVLALPRNLQGAGAALGLKVQKDLEGHKLMMKWCKPRKITKKDLSTRHTNPAELRRLIQYCVTDTDVEVDLFLKLPPLSKRERAIWLLDQKINLRGFLTDRPLVNTTLKLIKEESLALNSETSAISLGTFGSATQRAAVLEWLENEGVFLQDLRKKTVEDAVEAGLVSGDAKRMLELRLAISKTSTKKYEAFELRSRHDSRVRDILLYAAASTLRWGGMGVQPQNFPRGTIKNTVQAAEVVAEGDLELIRMIYGDPMSVFSSCLRNMIVAPKGKTLNVADYAAIETRVLFWVAKHEEGLKAFREGRDLYCEMAAEIFGGDPDEIRRRYKEGDLEAFFQRFVGKESILGCGYNMGGKKFASACALKGQPIEQDLADAAVKTYRTTHTPVVQLWSNIQKAAIYAIQNPGKRVSINRTSWFMKGRFLYCEVPSGGRLAYYRPSVVHEATPWGEKRPVIYHWGVDGLTKKFELQKTYGGKLVENVVQFISRELMADAMLRVEAAGPWEIVLSVHDELVGERDLEKGGSIEEFCSLLVGPSEWAKDCPIAVEGWEGSRYRK